MDLHWIKTSTIPLFGVYLSVFPPSPKEYGQKTKFWLNIARKTILNVCPFDDKFYYFFETKSNNDCIKGAIMGQIVIKPLSKHPHLTGSDGHLSSHLITEYHKSLFDNFFIWILKSETNV